MVLWKYSLREMLNRRGRAALTLLSIVIGVGIVVSASIATTHSISNTIQTAPISLRRVSMMWATNR